MKYSLIFLGSFALFAAISCLPAVEMYECQFLLNSDYQTIDENKNLSLSYFLGYGYDMEEMAQFDTIRLTLKGWLMVVLILLGTPALITYRFALKNRMRQGQ